MRRLVYGALALLIAMPMIGCAARRPAPTLVSPTFSHLRPQAPPPAASTSVMAKVR